MRIVGFFLLLLSSLGLAQGVPVAELLDWLRLLLVFDVIYVTVCAMVFPYMLEG